jgi:hypothetical protein
MRVRVSQLTCGRLLTKLHHLAQAHASCREAGIVADGVHQPLARLPRHVGGSEMANWTRWVVVWCWSGCSMGFSRDEVVRGVGVDGARRRQLEARSVLELSELSQGEFVSELSDGMPAKSATKSRGKRSNQRWRIT